MSIPTRIYYTIRIAMADHRDYGHCLTWWLRNRRN